MAQVKFTPNLKRFFPDLCECRIEAATVAEVVAYVDQRCAGAYNRCAAASGATRTVLYTLKPLTACLPSAGHTSNFR